MVAGESMPPSYVLTGPAPPWRLVRAPWNDVAPRIGQTAHDPKGPKDVVPLRVVPLQVRPDPLLLA